MQVFDTLPKEVQSVLEKLEKQDEKEREDNVDTKLRLRQIPRVTGEFLFNLVLSSVEKTKDWKGLEIGGSGAYSTMWQGLAVKKANQGLLTSLEIDEKKIAVSTKNIKSVDVDKFVSIVHTDAKEYVKKSDGKFDYVFIDAEKDDYLYYFKTLKDKVNPGCVWIADNVISHASDMKEFLDYLGQEPGFTFTVLTIGKGLAFVVTK